MEVDISIVDRVAEVFNPTPIYNQTLNGSKGPMYSSFLSGPFMVSVCVNLY